MARSKKACIVFFDEIDSIGGARGASDDGGGGTDNEVQRTMLQIVTELDGFDPRGNIKVLMATNRYVRRCRHRRPSSPQPIGCADISMMWTYCLPTVVIRCSHLSPVA